MITKPYLLEACVETVDEALFAAKNGADLLEVCSDLANDGCTPSKRLISEILNNVDIPLKIMVRPRTGNFEYNETELTQIRKTIEICHQMEIKQIVFGCLKNGSLDEYTLSQVSKWANGMHITFHKAIDVTLDPLRTLEKLKHYNNVTAILSSGQKATASEGISNLLKMKEVCPNRLTLIAAGSITKSNINEIHSLLNLNHYHGRKIVG